MDRIVHRRIYDSLYWKQRCFALDAATFCERAACITCIGGLYANQRACEFLCLVHKLVLMKPHREIIEEYLCQKHFKYLTAIAAVYVRLVYDPKDVYELLEPLLADYRKLRYQTRTVLELIHLDELVDMLLTKERVLDLTLPQMPGRVFLEDNQGLGNRVDFLDAWMQ